MNIWSLLLLFSCMNYLNLGVISYRFDSKSRVNRQMLLLCINFAFQAFTFAFMHLNENRADAFLWYRLSSISWIMYIPLALHMLLLLSHREKFLTVPYLCAIYLPGAFAIIIANVFFMEPAVLYRVPGGWALLYRNPSLMVIFVASYVIYLGAGFTSLFLWGLRSPVRRERKQMQIIMATSLFSLCAASIVDNILPILNIFVLPLLMPLLCMVFIFGTWYAIKQYRLLSINSSFAASEIIKNMNDLFFLVDHRGRILQTSPFTLRTLSRDEHGVYGSEFSELIEERHVIENVMRELNGIDGSLVEVRFKTAAAESIPVRLSGSALRDKLGDLLGAVFVGYDLRETKKIEELQRMMQNDMMIAANIQTSLLPAGPPQSGEWDIAYHFRPLFPVSGDFYDFYEIDGRFAGLCLFDVSGHGVSAGLIAMIGKTLAQRSFHKLYDRPLNTVMRQVNMELVKEIGALDNYVTGIVLRFLDGRVEYVNAGHTQLLRSKINSGETGPITLKGEEIRNFILGVESDRKYQGVEFPVSPGDRLLLFSDAMEESLSPGQERYGMARIVESFRKTATSDAHESLSRIMTDFTDHIGGQTLKDDLTVILLVKKGADGK